jgi:hypothetical protein
MSYSAGELQILTADRGYDRTWMRDYLREELDIHPLIARCTFKINSPEGARTV